MHRSRYESDQKFLLLPTLMEKSLDTNLYSIINIYIKNNYKCLARLVYFDLTRLVQKLVSSEVVLKEKY